MKKKVTSIALSAVLLITSIAQTGCFGEFALTRKIYEFNSGIAGDGLGGRFVRTLVMYGLMVIPVYSIAGFLDIVIFNLIEFWSGSNPLAMEPGEQEEQFMTFKGKTYRVTATQNQFAFARIENGVAIDEGTLKFNPQSSAWYAEKGDQTAMLFSVDDLNQESFTLSVPSAEGMKKFTRPTQLLDDTDLALN